MENMKTGIIENVKDTIVNDIILGDSRSRGEVFGRGALAVGEIVFGSKGIAQGIKGTGAAKNAVSAVDMMGDAADAVGDTAKGVKILGKIEDAEDIADTAGDVAERARKAEKVIDGDESGSGSAIPDSVDIRLNSLVDEIRTDIGKEYPVGNVGAAITDIEGVTSEIKAYSKINNSISSPNINHEYSYNLGSNNRTLIREVQI